MIAYWDQRSHSPKRWPMVMFNFYGSCFVEDFLYIISFSNFARSVSSYSLQFKRKSTGVSFTLQVGHSGEVSVSILLLWNFSVECPVFSLIILRIPLLEVFFRRVALSVNFLWDMLGTVSLYFVFWVFPSSSPFTYGEHFVTLLYFRWW